MKSGIGALAALVCIAALNGCAATKRAPDPAHTGDVAFRQIHSEGGDQYPEEGVEYVGAISTVENAPPQYPANLLAARLPPARVRARAFIDESGRVTQVVALEPDSADSAAFFGSLEAALKTWTYLPLVRVEKAPGSTTILAHDGKWVLQGKATALPFRMDYEFLFTQKDGQGAVATRKEVTPAPAPGR